MSTTRKSEKSHAKLACLPCRTLKRRCDGQNPCAGCVNNQRQCHYRPSRRGGARRGVKAAETRLRKHVEMASNHANGINDSRFMTQNRMRLDRNDVSLFPVSPETVDLHDRTAGIHPLFYSAQNSGGPRSPHTTVDAFSSTIQGSQGASPRSTEPNSTYVPCPTVTLRAYRCIEDLLNAYYKFIHPYFPMLPPPLVPQYRDCPLSIAVQGAEPDLSHLSQGLSSPLALALMAMFVLIPLSDDPHHMSETAIMIRRSYSGMYAQASLAAIDNYHDQADATRTTRSTGLDPSQEPRSQLHVSLPLSTEIVLALVLLGIYESIQRGNISKMRVRANQALTAAMDQNLHTVNADNAENSDVQCRAWWVVMTLVYQSSIVMSLPPMIPFDDHRITTPFPELRGCREPWPLFIKALELVEASCRVSHQLSTKHDPTQLPHTLWETVRELDASIFKLATEADRYNCLINSSGVEAEASRNMWTLSRALTHLARLKLHQLRAFLNHPVFLNEHCNLPCINILDFTQPHHRSPVRGMIVNENFPFTEIESASICLKSALVISRTFGRLPSPNSYPPERESETDNKLLSTALDPQHLGCPRSFPYLACSQLQSFYTVIMLFSKVRRSLLTGDLLGCYHLLDRPSPGTGVQDAERLCEELLQAAKTLRVSLRGDMIFDGIAAMAREVDGLYQATFS